MPLVKLLWNSVKTVTKPDNEDDTATCIVVVLQRVISLVTNVGLIGVVCVLAEENCTLQFQTFCIFRRSL